jgi:hypothetical protein
MGKNLVQKKFSIEETRKDDDSYFYSYTRYSWHVISTDTGDELFDFYGTDDEDQGGRTETGVRNVRFHDTKHAIVVEYAENGKPDEEIELPIKVWLTDDNKTLNLEYQDGHVIKGPRHEAVAFTKYGQPYSVSKLINPPKPEKE